MIDNTSSHPLSRDAELDSLCRQLASAKENLRLIEERKAEYVLEVDIPLQIIKGERRLYDRIAELEKSIALRTIQGNLKTDWSVAERDKIVQNSTQVSPIVGVEMLHQLPTPSPEFMGCEKELAELLAKFDQGVTISGLQGQGGIGKTALALKLAGQLMDRYPDAQIFLDLKGVSSSPLATREIMAHVVRSFDMTVKLPNDEAELAAAYRSALFHKRVLLLLDNARDAEQIKPLLPAPKGCGVIITSRQHFYVAGLYAQNLEAMPATDACALLIKIAPQIGNEAEHIARLCGYLPLMLTMAGSALAERINLSVASYVRRLEDTQMQLGMVAASFMLSYELLSEELRVTWRMLAVFPKTFEVGGAAAVCGLARSVIEMQLSELVHYSLVQWNSRTERYDLYALARLFASSKLSNNEHVMIQRRHAEYYRDVLSVCDENFLRGGQETMQGLALFDLEQENIRAGQKWAAEITADDDAARVCSDYAIVGIYCLGSRLDKHDLIGWLESALTAARQLKDRRSEGDHIGNLGNVYADLGETGRAIEYYKQALEIAREIGDRRGESSRLGNLGNAYRSSGETQRAIELHEQALKLVRELGDRRGEGIWLGNLGTSYGALGEARHAIEYYARALEIAHEIGDRRGEGIWLGNLGISYAALSKTQQAIECYEQALIIAREMNDRRGESAHLGNLGNAYAAQGDVRRSITMHEQVLKIDREINDQLGEETDLGNLGNAYSTLGQLPQAIEHYEQALVIAREIGDRPGVGTWLGNIGLSYAALGETQRAIEFYEQALEVAREIGDRYREGNQLGNLGNAYAALNETQPAIEYYEQALAIAHEIGDRRGEGTQSNNLGLVYAALGEMLRAIEYYKQALEISREVGDRYGEGSQLGNLGNAYGDIDEKQQAIGCYEQALAIAHEIGDWRGEGAHLNNLGLVYAALGEMLRAIEHMRAALKIFEEIESPFVEHVRKMLMEWQAALNDKSKSDN